MTGVPDDQSTTAGPVPVTNADQQWFWTERWQQMEHTADRDIAVGRVTRFDTADDFLAALDVL